MSLVSLLLYTCLTMPRNNCNGCWGFVAFGADIDVKGVRGDDNDLELRDL